MFPQNRHPLSMKASWWKTFCNTITKTSNFIQFRGWCDGRNSSLTLLPRNPWNILRPRKEQPERSPATPPWDFNTRLDSPRRSGRTPGVAISCGFARGSSGRTSRRTRGSPCSGRRPQSALRIPRTRYRCKFAGIGCEEVLRRTGHGTELEQPPVLRASPTEGLSYTTKSISFSSFQFFKQTGVVSAPLVRPC